MKKLFPIALIAFIAVLGTSCKKEVQEAPKVETSNKATKSSLFKPHVYLSSSIDAPCECSECKPKQNPPPK